MRIVMVHNPHAGAEAVSGQQLRALIAEAGHQVIYRSTTDGEWRSALREEADLYVAAGGDGTVRKVVIELAGTDAPVALIPLGTANNIARSLGVPTADPESSIASWGTMTAEDFCSFDVPLVESVTGQQRFVESIGGGLFAELLAAAEREEARGSSGGGLGDAARLLRDLLQATPPARQWSLLLDDQDLSGLYVGVEAMNIGDIGPRVRLAAGADPSDGLLAVVTIEEHHLDELADQVDCLGEEDTPECQFTGAVTHRGRHLRIRGPGDEVMHIDDRSCSRGEAGGGAPLEVRMDAIKARILASGSR